MLFNINLYFTQEAQIGERTSKVAATLEQAMTDQKCKTVNENITSVVQLFDTQDVAVSMSEGE